MILTDMIFGNGGDWLEVNNKITWLMIVTYFICSLAAFSLSALLRY